MSRNLEITIEEELLSEVDYYCAVYSIDRSTAINFLLNGALQTALPNPNWLIEAEPDVDERDPYSSEQSASENINSSQPSPPSEDADLDQVPDWLKGMEIAAPIRNRSIPDLSASPLVQNRHNKQTNTD